MMVEPEKFIKITEKPLSERKQVGSIKAIDKKGNVRERPIFEVEMGVFDPNDNLLHEVTAVIYHMGKRV